MLPDAWTSGSSIMPQKKNPDAAELLRAKAPRAVSNLVRLYGVLHALPLTYNKDMQEDKEPLFDARRHARRCAWPRRRGMIAGARFDRERMAAAASDELIAATDLADLLVKRGTPFREAHGVVAGLVRESVESGAAFRDVVVRGARRRRRRGARPVVVARVEGLRGRHVARPRARAARAGPRAARTVIDRAFYDAPGPRRRPRPRRAARSRHGDTRGRDRRDRGLPLHRGGLPRVRRA